MSHPRAVLYSAFVLLLLSCISNSVLAANSDPNLDATSIPIPKDRLSDQPKLFSTPDGLLYATDGTGNAHIWKSSMSLPTPANSSSSFSRFLTSPNGTIYYVRSEKRVDVIPYSLQRIVLLSPLVLRSYPDLLFVGKKEVHVFKLDPISGRILCHDLSNNSQCETHDSTDSTLPPLLVTRTDYTIQIINQTLGHTVYDHTHHEYLRLFGTQISGEPSRNSAVIPVRSQAGELFLGLSEQIFQRHLGNDSEIVLSSGGSSSQLATIPSHPTEIPIVLHLDSPHSEYDKLIIILLTSLLLIAGLVILRLIYTKSSPISSGTSEHVMTSVSDSNNNPSAEFRSRGVSDFGHTGRMRASSSSEAAYSQGRQFKHVVGADNSGLNSDADLCSPAKDGKDKALMVYGKQQPPYAEMMGWNDGKNLGQQKKHRVVENNEYMLEKEEGTGIVRTMKHEVKEYFPEEAEAELIEEAKVMSKNMGTELQPDHGSLTENKIMMGYKTEKSPEETGTESRSFYAVSINRENERCDENGRFGKSFDCVKLLGSGGFAEVFKARYVMDGKFYAVKRIVIQHDVQQRVKKRKAYREIRAMQTFDHPYIVRYITCWIEIPSTSMLPPTKSLTLEAALDSSKGKDKTRNEEVPESNAPPTEGLGFAWDRPEDSKVSQSGAAATGTKDAGSEREQQMALRNADQSKEVSQLNSSAVGVQWDRTDNSHITTVKQQVTSKHPKPIKTSEEAESHSVGLIFYIQMVMYSRTLKDYLAERTIANNRQNLKYFTQIAEAIREIHSKRWIHRDMKPANVFLDENDNAKVGDFGLAVEIKPAEEDCEVDSQEASHGTSGSHTENVGTKQYLSLEQESGYYSEKVDIYSIGLILLELCCVFSTGHEKSRAFEEIRRTHALPDCFDKEKHGEEAGLILGMTERDPERRPSAEEILSSPLLKAWKDRCLE